MAGIKPDVHAIFDAAIECPSVADRARYLDEACSDTPHLRSRVEALIRAHCEAGSFLGGASPTVVTQAAARPVNIEQPGTTIGRYKLIHEIGQGGMGVVYMAAQSQPIQRNVALKIIKPGMDTKEVVSRFEAERQALALMAHPSIAHVLDGGSTDSGRPYFVMELVDGTPITDFCDASRYTTRQRLELFVQVCQAIQHAHQKGIIHRDIKPSNILVTTADDVAVPKVIDFGIAKAVHQPLTDGSLHTRATHIIGTPSYMSPEQAQLGGQDIDTRTDVYSLGVVLYELLTGTTPFDKERLDRSGLDEVKRIIQEEQPPRPSTRLSTVDTALETIAEKHSCDPQTLARELGGELDWIVMKCLEKDRTRRYESASELAKDIQRYLDDEPVEACPPSKLYRIGKFTRRYKGPMATAAMILLALVVGTSLATWQAIRAAAAEQLATEQKETAERNLRAAMDALERMLANVGNPELADVPKLQEIRAKILQDTLNFYERFKSDSGSSPSVDYRAAKLYLELGKFTQATNPDSKEVITAYSAGLELADALVLRHPKRNDFRELKAEMHMACADYWWLPKPIATKEDYARAMKHFEQAEQQYAYLSLANPGQQDYDTMRGAVFARMSNLYRSQSPTDPRAAESANRAVESGYVSHALMAKIAEPNDPGLAEQHWRKLVAGQGAMSNPLGDSSGQMWNKILAASFFAQRDPELAERLWQEVISEAHELVKDFPSHKGYWGKFDRTSLEYSRFLLGAESRPQALRKVDTLIQSHSAFHALRAKILDAWSDADAQLQMFNESIRRYPTQKDYYVFRARALENRGELDSALSDLNHALELDEYHQYAYARRADVHSKLANYQQAVDDYTRWFTMRGGVDWHRYKRRAAAYFELGKYVEALADLNRAIGQHREHLSALTWIDPAKVAACPDHQFRTGVLKLADRAVELNEGSAESRAARASLLLELGQVERAKEDVSMIEQADSASFYDLYRAALIALRLDDRARYRKLCQKLVDAIDESDEAIATHFAAWTAALAPDSLKDYQPAISLAEASVEAAPNDRQFQTGLGAIQMRAGLYEQALASLEKSKELESTTNSSDAYAAFVQAITQHHLGRTRLARESLAEATALADQELGDETKIPLWNRRLTLKLLREEAETLVSSNEHNDTEPTDKPEETAK